MRKFVVLPVALPDGNMQSIEADSAITASEICNKIAAEIELKDIFGFSLFICIFDKVYISYTCTYCFYWVIC